MEARSVSNEKSPIEEPAAPDTASRHGLVYVCLAVLFFSTSPVLILWANPPFNAVEIAFWRLTIATLLVAMMGVFTHQHLWLKRQEVPRFIFYGLVTALHFIFYIASLSFTTIAHSLSITYTSPIFVTLFSVLFLRESLAIRKYIGIGITILGIAVLAGFEPHYTACSFNGPGHCMLLGDGIALLSSLCFSIYSIAGRSERERHPLFRYTTNVYGIAALWLLPIMLFFAFRHAYPLAAMAAVLGLGIIPLGLGHTLYNASLRYIHATYANIIATQEVTMGVILGIFLVHQIPSITAVIGGIIALIGIVCVLV